MSLSVVSMYFVCTLFIGWDGTREYRHIAGSTEGVSSIALNGRFQIFNGLDFQIRTRPDLPSFNRTSKPATRQTRFATSVCLFLLTSRPVLDGSVQSVQPYHLMLHVHLIVLWLSLRLVVSSNTAFPATPMPGNPNYTLSLCLLPTLSRSFLTEACITSLSPFLRSKGSIHVTCILA